MEPTPVFLLLTTVVTVAGVAAGTLLSVLWFIPMLRRCGLRVRFGQARRRPPPAQAISLRPRQGEASMTYCEVSCGPCTDRSPIYCLVFPSLAVSECSGVLG